MLYNELQVFKQIVKNKGSFFEGPLYAKNHYTSYDAKEDKNGKLNQKGDPTKSEKSEKSKKSTNPK
jgi:hypothetical protein